MEATTFNPSTKNQSLDQIKLIGSESLSVYIKMLLVWLKTVGFRFVLKPLGDAFEFVVVQIVLPGIYCGFVSGLCLVLVGLGFEFFGIHVFKLVGIDLS